MPYEGRKGRLRVVGSTHTRKRLKRKGLEWIRIAGGARVGKKGKMKGEQTRARNRGSQEETMLCSKRVQDYRREGGVGSRGKREQ